MKILSICSTCLPILRCIEFHSKLSLVASNHVNERNDYKDCFFIVLVILYYIKSCGHFVVALKSTVRCFIVIKTGGLIFTKL